MTITAGVSVQMVLRNSRDPDLPTLSHYPKHREKGSGGVCVLAVDDDDRHHRGSSKIERGSRAHRLNWARILRVFNVIQEDQ